MDKCNAKELLSSHNLKATKQRVLILDEIINNLHLFTANTIFELVSENVDLVTVYRVLNKFLEEGIVREILGQGDSKTYELSCIHNPVHPHFSCSKCGKLFCLKAVKESILSDLEDGCDGFTVNEITIQFSGICKSCSSL